MGETERGAVTFYNNGIELPRADDLAEIWKIRSQSIYAKALISDCMADGGQPVWLEWGEGREGAA